MPTARNAEQVANLSTSIPIAEGEDPWTAEDLAEIREDLFSDGSEGAGRDPADVGSSNFERDQEMSLAQNAKEMLEQANLALRRFDSGDYGTCESCGQPIGKDRLQVFPRATLCMPCKQREERR